MHDLGMNALRGDACPRAGLKGWNRSGVAPLGAALLAVSLLAACGGGGSDAGTGNPPTTLPTPPTTPGGTPSEPTTPPTTPTDPGTPTNPTTPTATCADGANYECSGDSILRTENGVALTNFGVQVYARSTSDLMTPNANKTAAFGMAPASGGLAEIRVARDSNGAVSAPAVILKNLGLSWDGRVERPPIIETFLPTQGRVQLNANGALQFLPLPDSSDLGFYDVATKGVNGTQANYANNRYFPRSGNPSRCGPSQTTCLSTETTGVHREPGDWRSGGTVPDWAEATRFHGDGDVHAGDGMPDANGNRTILPGGSGIGVPFPGSKGYRQFGNLSLQYSNLSAWSTHDTVLIHEWGGSDEHNKNRRGVVAFGSVSPAAAIPASGTARYSGTVYGWYARNNTADPSVFQGDATLSVNFSTREVTISIQNTVTRDAAGTPVPVVFSTVAAMGNASGVMNYLTGAVATSTMRGGVSARYFGPLVTTGASGAGPAESAGTFTLSNSATGAVAIGGFIGRKQ